MTDPTTLPAPAPVVPPETKPYWDATAEGRLVLPKCVNCGSINWYPKAFCPVCSNFGVEWIDAQGTGSVYSFTITRRGSGAYAQAGPYVLAYVELDEGPRIMTNIVDADLETLAVGDRVEVEFHETGSGTSLARFHPLR
jgi:uncharacterized OB-fold protein